MDETRIFDFDFDNFVVKISARWDWDEIGNGMIGIICRRIKLSWVYGRFRWDWADEFIE